jgi:tryptophan synthase alpha chain
MQRHSDLHDFIRQSSGGRKLLAIYLTCGFPKLDWTVELAREAFDAGADLIELGMPFSDPLADGPVIQDCSQRALENGITLDHFFQTASQISTMGRVLFMGYMNSVLARGVREFVTHASGSGLSGAIVPDWPIEENAEAREWDHRALPRIPFIAPTSSRERIREIDAYNAPFIYAVSVAGVTGMRELDQSVVDYLGILKSELRTPFLVGFGVSDAQTARQLANVSHGVIVGSAVLKGIGAAGTLVEAEKLVREFVGSLRRALDTHA